MSARGLSIASVEALPDDTVAPVLESQSGVRVQVRPDCVRLTPTDEDPWVAFSVDPGARVFVAGEATGEGQVYVQVDGSFSEIESRRFVQEGPPTVVAIPASDESGPWVLRVDPPAEGKTRLCVSPVN
jgi:hypothetical protein